MLKTKDKKPKELFLLVIILLLLISLPLQYLVQKEVVVGLPSDAGHSEAHEGHEEEGHSETEEVRTGPIIVTNFGFEVGTREQIWGWSQVGTDQGAVIFRDDDVSRWGFASAAINTNDALVNDCGWYTKLDELPLARDLVFSGYVKTEALKGEAYLRVLCQGALEGQEQQQLLASLSTDDLHGDHDWTLTSLECFIPPEASGIWLEIGMFGSGQAWFDDLSLEVKERQDRIVVGENLIRNPELADAARFWHVFGTTTALLDYGNVVIAGQPTFLLRCNSGTEDNSTVLYQSLSGFYGRTGTLTISGRMRCEVLRGEAFLGLRILRAGGEMDFRSANAISGNMAWTDFNAAVILDGSVDDVWVSANMQGSGSLYVSSLTATYEEKQ
ncbi:MAG: hypothetical protein A2W01_07180 [Candidatus Solincola sediminis]|uniref:CBM-cenC domain-containing protein n=1 Tax=Candidatus Solincola sediminis TaxID=1797199 RepID=A0A1F2WRG6_9ACTN|nr:MAG: hypothetical protein A2Y75_11440 [Candidatus Solincola sediminis]OFW59909.1 MAG: hypothetical protein A2W01_07180 [Candidatus Solincola sediminis]